LYSSAIIYIVFIYAPGVSSWV